MSKPVLNHYWFSKKQLVLAREIIREIDYKDTYCNINGDVLQYTECTSSSHPLGTWDDYKYLGIGVFDHAE